MNGMICGVATHHAVASDSDYLVPNYWAMKMRKYLRWKKYEAGMRKYLSILWKRISILMPVVCLSVSKMSINKIVNETVSSLI